MKDNLAFCIKYVLALCKQVILEHSPLVHCMTNPVTMQDMANLLSSIGASPLMSMHKAEVAEVHAVRDAFLCNLGATTAFDEMLESAILAKSKKIPVIVDPVGVSFSSYRREQVMRLLDTHAVTHLKGNLSEILTIATGHPVGRGVDAKQMRAKEETLSILSPVMDFAKSQQVIVIATGKTDIITDGERMITVDNGTMMLKRVTGSGCLLGAMIGVYAAVLLGEHSSIDWNEEICKRDLLAPVLACVHTGVSGEIAEMFCKKTNTKMASFKLKWMDELSDLDMQGIENLKIMLKCVMS